jgi:AraC-like DNA-binding protein
MESVRTSPEYPASRVHPLSAQVTSQRCFFQPARAARASGVAYGGVERCTPDYAIARDGFSFQVLEFIAAGRGTAMLNGVTETLRPGSVLRYGPGTRLYLRCDPAAPMTKYFLCFSGARAAARLRRAGLPAGRVLSLPRLTEVQETFEQLIRDGQRHQPSTPRVCELLAELLLLRIVELSRSPPHGVTGAGEEMFHRCRRLIDEEAPRLCTLEEVAARCGTTSAQVCRLFRRHHGMSPYRYLLQRKMDAAAELLRHSGCLVKEVGERVGFPDAYHFSRRFKAVFGVSPRSFGRQGGIASRP